MKQRRTTDTMNLDEKIRIAEEIIKNQKSKQVQNPKPSSNNDCTEAEPTLERVKQPAPEIPR